MEDRKFILKETATIAVGVSVCVAVMIGIFALLGYFDWKVLVGGIIGGVLAVANFFAMAISASLAADKAENQDVKGGQALLQMSYMGRLLGLGYSQAEIDAMFAKGTAINKN